VPRAPEHRPGCNSEEYDHVGDDGGERGHHEHAQRDTQYFDHVFIVIPLPGERNPDTTRRATPDSTVVPRRITGSVPRAPRWRVVPAGSRLDHMREYLCARGGSDEGQPHDGGAEGVEPAARAPVRVVVVDDHVLVRDGTLQLLDHELDIEVVGQAGTAEEGLEVLGRTHPDVALVDVNLPGTSGLELARDAATRYPQVRILVVSAYDDYAYVTEALEAGVGGYLLKTASARQLLDSVRAVADGVFVLDKALSGRIVRRWRDGGAGLHGPGALTPRETDVLTLLARGLSNKQMATELDLGLRTVEGHVSVVLAKLGATSRTEAVLSALAHHLVDPDSDGSSLRPR